MSAPKRLSERTKAALQSVLEAYPHDPYGPHSAAAEGCIHCSVLAEVALVLSQEDFDEIDAALAGQPEAPTPDAVRGLVEALLATAKRTVMSWTPSPLDGPCWCESDPDDEDKHGRPYNGGEHEEHCLKIRAALSALKEKP